MSTEQRNEIIEAERQARLAKQEAVAIEQDYRHRNPCNLEQILSFVTNSVRLHTAWEIARDNRHRIDPTW